MTSENKINQTDGPPTEIVVAAEVVAQEKVILQLDVTALQSQIGFMQEEARLQSVLAALMSQLEVANENLVAASIHVEQMEHEADAVERRQNEFLAMLAHELRGPLAPITIATALLERLTDAHPKLPMVHGLIHRQLDNMTRLLNDLLDASRVSTGKITLVRTLVDVDDLIQAAVEISQPFIDKRGHQLFITIENPRMMVRGDPMRLAQVISNLIINSANFTPDGGRISISASRCADKVEIAVVDNGSGISAELLPYVFDLFTQGPRPLARTDGGLGIGLMLVQSIVEQHGGTVRVDSEGAGCGSEFIVSLPLSPDLLPSPVVP